MLAAAAEASSSAEAALLFENLFDNVLGLRKCYWCLNSYHGMHVLLRRHRGGHQRVLVVGPARRLRRRRRHLNEEEEEW
jgi:hypothetical protein